MLHSNYFTTESYPSNQRLTAWRDALERLSLHVHRIAPHGTVYGTVSSAISPQGLTFASISSGPQQLSYQDASHSGAICLTLHLEGEAILTHEARETSIVCGDIVFGPTGARGELSLQTNFRQLLVKIPRKALRSRLPTALSLKVGRLRGDSGIGHVFAGMLGSVADMIDNLTIDQLRPIEIALSEFLVSSLADAESTHPLVGATSTQTSNLHRITQYIEARLGEPDLNIAKVAAEVGVSTRYLQKLFESVDETFSHYVLLRRLDHCRADLINPLYAHLSISDICFRWSFNDAARFSRTFREQYRMSPSTYRADIGEAVSKNVLQHMSRGWPGSSEQELKKLRQQEVRPVSGVCAAVPLHSPSQRSALAALPPLVVCSGAHQHYLPANAQSVHWGYFSRSLKPVIEVQSGDILTIETLSHHSNDDHERMVAGDPGAESVFHWTPRGKNVERRGAGPSDASIYGRGSGEGFGVHICTGPVAVTGAQPGDVMEVRILDVMPRPSASPQYFGRCFGSNAATWWGYHYQELLTEPKPREVVTIYELHGNGHHEFARAVYNFRWTPQTDPYGIAHPTIDYPGVRVDHSSVVENHGVLKNISIPVRPHFGVIALAPKEADIVDSIPPSYFGGNIDNKRAGKGSTIYLPVSVPGGLFSVGDPHASQGDAELCGTAIECSMTGMFQLILHKKADLGAKPFADLNYPLLETKDEWVVHGFSYANYLAELGDRAQSEIYKKSTLDSAMKDAFRKMRRFLMTAKNLSEDEAISLISVAVDFGITQVVDGNWCVHGVLRKSLFLGETHE